jgi:protein-L-isoaspartate(D-aspartate) O-methyltransferase
MSPDVLDFESARSKMIEQQIRPWNVLDPNVLELLKKVRREDFVPSAYRHLAFVDMEIPLPEGQVMLAPKIEARMLQELNLIGSDRVLEIGTGSGHMAALIAQVAASVLSIEKHPGLATLAKENLERSRVANVEVQQANGLAEDPRWAHTGFDCVVISGALESIPDHLLRWLKPGGRLVAIVGEPPVMQAVLVERAAGASSAGFRTTVLFETLTKYLEDAPKTSRFRF